MNRKGRFFLTDIMSKLKTNETLNRNVYWNMPYSQQHLHTLPKWTLCGQRHGKIKAGDLKTLLGQCHPTRSLSANICRHFMCSRSSVCRMSSKDKMNVQDQSKERGVSGGLELSEEKESSPGKPAAVSSVWPEVLHTPNVNVCVMVRILFSQKSAQSPVQT